MLSKQKSDQPLMELDLRGSICPGPTADTLAALKKLPVGGKLAVITDYLPARQTIPRLVEQGGLLLGDDRRRRRDFPDRDSEMEESNLWRHATKGL